MGFKILAINPGSTSTKIALFDDSTQIFKTNIEHPSAELEKYKTIADQYEMRHDAILEVMKSNSFDVKRPGCSSRKRRASAAGKIRSIQG